MVKEISYFEKSKTNKNFYDIFMFPKYLENVLPKNKNTKILDIGCGFGQILKGLKQRNYSGILGIDDSKEAIKFCKKTNLPVENIDLESFLKNNKQKFDFIILSHLLEHLKKEEIIPVLTKIKERLLKETGKVCIMVPNAQSNTGCYWAYEDFTHNTLFTTGSLFYVLKSAGFNEISFLDIDATENFGIFVKIIRKTFLPIYKLSNHFWNRITASGYHKPSPKIFTYEIKVLAR